MAGAKSYPTAAVSLVSVRRMLVLDWINAVSDAMSYNLCLIYTNPKSPNPFWDGFKEWVWVWEKNCWSVSHWHLHCTCHDTGSSKIHQSQSFLDNIKTTCHLSAEIISTLLPPPEMISTRLVSRESCGKLFEKSFSTSLRAQIYNSLSSLDLYCLKNTHCYITQYCCISCTACWS